MPHPLRVLLVWNFVGLWCNGHVCLIDNRSAQTERSTQRSCSCAVWAHHPANLNWW